MELGTIIALVGSCLSAASAAGVCITLLVRMRRDIDGQKQGQETASRDLGEFKIATVAAFAEVRQDNRAVAKDVSDMRVAFADLSATVKAHFQTK